jgi:hypothetical protein
LILQRTYRFHQLIHHLTTVRSALTLVGICRQRSMLAASRFGRHSLGLYGRDWRCGFAGGHCASHNQGDPQFLCQLPGRIGKCHPWTNFQLPNAAGCKVLDITSRVECPHD